MKKMLMAVVVGMMIFGMTVHAGDGVPDDYLSMESSSIEDGAKDVPVDVEVFMKFSNNVVNLKVSENNLTCFTLLDSEGGEVPIDVLIGDDQIDRTIKNDMTVKPQVALEEGETYKLVISENLMAKNGKNMQEDMVISFTTEGEAAADRTYLYLVFAVIIAAAAVLLTRKKKA